MSARPSHPRAAAAPKQAPIVSSAPAQGWVRWAVLASAVLLLFCFSSGPVADTDTWWHLKTGQYILQQRKLPVPDPFAYTTYSGTAAYPGEEVTRYFNLTHEWLAQVFLYASYAVGGFAGLVLMRSLWMCTFCGLAGWIVWRRTGGLYDVVLLFVIERHALEERFEKLTATIVANGAVWVCWPKRASGVGTDLTENVVREHGLLVGLVDVKVAAIDATWSGLKFVRRLADRAAASSRHPDA